MDKYLDTIKKCILFNNIEDTDILKILNSINAKVVNFKKYEYIINMLDKPLEFGLMLSGSANIQKVDYNGNINILSNINKYELFAEAFVYADIDKSLVNVCCSEDCTVLLINKDNILNLAYSDVNLYKKLNDNMLKCMSKKLVSLNRKIGILTGQNIREKVLIYLNELSNDNTKNIIEVPFNREQLADFLCVNRASLSRELSKMKNEGLIDFYKNTFKLL